MNAISKNKYNETFEAMYSNYRKKLNIDDMFPEFSYEIVPTVLSTFDSTKEVNGRLLLPEDDNLNFTILIAKKQFEDGKLYTVYHEFTHLFDYYQYFDEFGNVEIMNKKDQEKYFYRGFRYWSEFNAVRKGVYLYLKDKNKKVPLSLFHTEQLIFDLKEFKNNPKNTHDVFINLLAYFSKLSIFQSKLTINPDPKFPRDLLIEIFGPEIISLYNLLFEMNNYYTAKINFGKLNNLIVKVFQHTISISSA